MIKAKVIGATGYGGIGIIELLLGHPQAQIVRLDSINDIGTPISALYPHLQGLCDLPIANVKQPDETPVDVVFMATPDGVGMQLAGAQLQQGARVIDYSGDFRFHNSTAYADYATRIGRDPAHAAPELLPQSVYGLAELHREDLRGARLVGNPGCFAVSCILGLAPAVRNNLVGLDRLICDCKTGISGAGKKTAPTFHYPARYENMNAYKLAGHQHVCEIEHELSAVAGAPASVTFTAQAVPMCRGIMSTLYGALCAGVKPDDVLAAYREFYKDCAFVRLYGPADQVGTVHVRGSNFCNLVVDVDRRTDTLRVVAYIDNLMKGQAGSALQNMNLICGLPETTGLMQPGRYP
ncbi:MAG: N-acetyl-gamma-glutamyl-phosphate reductase [Kiritimatiellia bacterium]|nr:N-acetyl-gamma-glutamyl-phosphate reductase [Lentisphaerota bacterium]